MKKYLTLTRWSILRIIDPQEPSSTIPDHNWSWSLMPKNWSKPIPSRLIRMPGSVAPWRRPRPNQAFRKEISRVLSHKGLSWTHGTAFRSPVISIYIWFYIRLPKYLFSWRNQRPVGVKHWQTTQGPSHNPCDHCNAWIDDSYHQLVIRSSWSER